MSDNKEKNILSGGPDPPLIDNKSKSLGGVILKKLTVNGNDVMFVSKIASFILGSMYKSISWYISQQRLCLAFT